MPKKSDTTIDEILKEMRIIQREKKRDKLFSKIDSSFFVLITLATFFSSITITWHQTLIESKALPILVGLVSTLLYAFVIGFKGMVSDSLDTRTFSWTILLTSCLWGIGFSIMVSSANIFSDWLICGISAKFIISASFGGFVGLFAIAIEKKFMSWIERKLSSLLSESIKVSASMPKKIYWTVFGIWGISLFFAIMLSELLL